MRTTHWVVIVVLLVVAAGIASLVLRGGSREAREPAVTEAGSGAASPLTGAETARPADTAARRRPKAAFDIVRVAPDGAAVIAGRTAPGAEVTVRAGDETIGKVTADARGEWVLVPEKPLASGAVELSQKVKPKEGKAFESEQVVVVVVPERGADGRGERALVMRTPREGGGSDVLQGPKPELGPAYSKGLSLEAVDYGETGDLVLSGKASPGATVRSYIDNEAVGSARGGPEGKWRLEVDRPVEPGLHKLRLDQVGEGGKVEARLEVPLRRAAPGELKLVEGRVVVQPGNSLWRIARAVYGRGVRYTVIYQANADQIRDPDLIYPGQVFALPEAD